MIMTVFVFSVVSYSFLTLFLSCQIGVTLYDLKNSGQLPVQEVLAEVLMILFYRFS